MIDLSLHILQHALGVNDYGRDDKGHFPAEHYRNRFVTGPGGKDWDLCEAHVAAGRMTKHGPSPMYGGGESYCFCVTDEGIAYVRAHSPRPPKLTRSQRRYEAWLDADCGLSFGEWLKHKPVST